ncbi:hypothetical protein [Streptomyces sp. NPDC054783]
MIAVALSLLLAASLAGVRVLAVLASIAALPATVALCSAGVRRKFGCVACLFILALYALVPVAIPCRGVKGCRFRSRLPNFYIM